MKAKFKLILGRRRQYPLHLELEVYKGVDCRVFVSTGIILESEKQWDDVQKETLPYIANSQYKSSTYACDGDIIIADTAEDETVGKATELLNIQDSHVVSGLHTMWLRPLIANRFAKGYMGYAFNSAMFHDQLYPLMQGTKVTSISKSAIKETYICNPPTKSEQQAIATALTDIDNLIAELGNLIEKKKAIKEGAMQELLTGKKRLEGFSEPWVEKKLGEVCRTSSGGTPSRDHEDYYNGNIKWVTTSELKDCVIYDSKEHISTEALSNSSAKIFPSGTLLMAMYGATIGKLGVLKTEASTNQACCAIWSDIIDLSFLFYVLLHNRASIIEKGCGAGQPNISQKIISDLTFALPNTFNEQKEISGILSDMDSEISALEAKRAKYEQMKQGMMQELLTGKIRLI